MRHVFPHVQQDVYFHTCDFMRGVLPHVCCHETCTLHDTSKRGPCNRVTGMHCSIIVETRKVMHVKMKLQLSSTIINFQTHVDKCLLHRKCLGDI